MKIGGVPAIAAALRSLLDGLLAPEAGRETIAWFYTPMALEFAAHLRPERPMRRRRSHREPVTRRRLAGRREVERPVADLEIALVEPEQRRRLGDRVGGRCRVDADDGEDLILLDGLLDRRAHRIEAQNAAGADGDLQRVPDRGVALQSDQRALRRHRRRHGGGRRPRRRPDVGRLEIEHINGQAGGRRRGGRAALLRCIQRSAFRLGDI